jgi:hypothetical protein
MSEHAALHLSVHNRLEAVPAGVPQKLASMKLAGLRVGVFATYAADIVVSHAILLSSSTTVSQKTT